MKSNPSDQRTGKVPSIRQSEPFHQTDGQSQQESQAKMNHALFSSAHILRLQQTIGNRAAGTVIQRMIDASDSHKFKLDWASMDFNKAMKVQNLINDGSWIPEEGEMEKLKAIIKKGKEEEKDTEETNSTEKSLEKDAMEEDSEDKKWYDQISELEKEEGSQEDDLDKDPNHEETISAELLDVFERLEPDFAEKVKSKKRKLPGKTVQGEMLEQHVTLLNQTFGIGEKDANQYYKNIPGIDHLVDKSYPFLQDKMHLSKHTANIKSYRLRRPLRYMGGIVHVQRA